MERELQGALSAQKHFQTLYESACEEYEKLWNEMVGSGPASNSSSLSMEPSVDMSEWPFDWIQGDHAFGAVGPAGLASTNASTNASTVEEVPGGLG